MPSALDQGLGKLTAVHIPFPQSPPPRTTIDREKCLTLKGKKCRQPCATACGPQAVEVEQQDEAAGLRLPELVRGFTHVIIGDTLKYPLESGRASGDIVRFDAADSAGGRRHGPAHSIGLRTALELGRESGERMPEEVVMFVGEELDVEMVGEELSPPVAERVVEPMRGELGSR